MVVGSQLDEVCTELEERVGFKERRVEARLYGYGDGGNEVDLPCFRSRWWITRYEIWVSARVKVGRVRTREKCGL